MHKKEFERLEGMLPVTVCPFKSTVTCAYYKQELPQARAELVGQQLSGRREI